MEIVEHISNTSFVGIGSEPLVHSDFYKKCYFNHFTPRTRMVRFTGVFDMCEFNKAEFNLCTLAGSYYNCTFRGANWHGAYWNAPRFINCDFANADISKITGLMTARFNEGCTGIKLLEGHGLIPAKDGEYRIGRIETGLVLLNSALRLVGKQKNSVRKVPRGYMGDFGDEDTNPGYTITSYSRKAVLYSSDLEEYKRNCGK